LAVKIFICIFVV